eukprot:184390_1
MFDELVVAEKLLASKSRVSNETTVSELNKVWKGFVENACKNMEENSKEIEAQIKNCSNLNSSWFIRKNPPSKHFSAIKSVLCHQGQ